MAKYYLLASMSLVLQPQHENMRYASEIMDSLFEMFMNQARPAHQEAIKNIMNTRMEEDTPVRDYLLKMMRFFNDAKILGVDIDGET